ncbi:MAG TPA: hypothetical protein VMG10_01475 [Gemmataceae bacterium]|nr:hypothetical protein [Gemmataceae bacterium]
MFIRVLRGVRGDGFAFFGVRRFSAAFFGVRRFSAALFCLLFVEKRKKKSGGKDFWSAALFRRFVLLGLFEKRKKKSGGKAPHSKKSKARGDSCLLCQLQGG